MTVDDVARLTKGQVERLQALTSALAGAVTVDDVVEAILTHGPAVVDARDALVALATGGDNPDVHSSSGTFVGVSAQDQGVNDAAQPLTDALTNNKALFFSCVDEVAAAYPGLSLPGAGGAPDGFLAAAIPMSAKVGESPIAVLGFVTGTDGGLSPAQQAIAELAAGQCAQALDRARLYDADRHTAETLQRALLPARFPDTDGVHCAVRYLPAAEHEAVGGDWYAVIRLDGGKVGLAVGDVAGHGLAAATAMGTMRNALRALATTTDRPTEVLDALNRFVCSQLAEEMATCVYVVVDPQGDTISYANAGHLPPLLVGAGPESAYLQEVLQPPLGVAPNTRYQEGTRPLGDSCLLVLYTDGLIERRRESIDLGLRDLLRATLAAELDPEGLCDHLLATLVGDQALEDDAALLTAALASNTTSPAARRDGAQDGSLHV